MKLPKGKKIYFASDNHLGIPTLEESHKRERLFVEWLEKASKDAYAIILLGDLFDMWIEYRKVVPKGFVRVLGKLAELTDRGIRIHFFLGNHDRWMGDYFEKELGIIVHKDDYQEFVWNEKRFFIAHGDGLGKGDLFYKVIKKVLKNGAFNWLMKRFHPNFLLSLAQTLSQRKVISRKKVTPFLGKEKEMLVQFCYQKLKEKPYDYFVFGHRHLPIVFQLNKTSTYINTGDWVTYFTYATFDGKELTLSALNKKTDIFVKANL